MLTLPSIFSDHMVLQRGLPIRLWGLATAGQAVEGYFGDNRITTIADANGRWRFEFPPQSAQLTGTTLTLRAGSEHVIVHDVLIGEVWLCSGQSNMEMSLDATIATEDNLVRAEATTATPLKASIIAIPPAGLRFIKIINAMADAPCADCGGAWQLGTVDTVRALTAIGGHFAERIGTVLDVPIGIIHCAWGCSSIEAWMSRGALDSNPALAATVNRHQAMLARFPQDREQFAALMDAWYAKNIGVIPDAQAHCKGIDDAWAHPDSDSTGWLPVARPFLRPIALADDRDGVVWFRREITIPHDWDGKECQGDLGIIDGQAAIFLDGKQVWEKTDRDPFHWLRPCRFVLPQELMVPGRHRLAVRMLLQFCSGSRYDVVDAFHLHPTDAPTQRLALADGWTTRTACSFPQPVPQRLQGAPPWPSGAPWDMRSPSRIFNAMVAPLAGYTMRGVLWYQGETNVPHPEEYRHLLPAFIRDWRAWWQQERLHVGIVQLADFGPAPSTPTDSDLACLREAQQHAADTVEDTGLATAIDSGEPHDIHPRDKQRPAHRLAAWALAHVYRSGGRLGSPRVASCVVNGTVIQIAFSGVVGGLTTRDGALPAAFSVAGADGVFRNAAAVIITSDTIAVPIAGLSGPYAVRYAWYDNPAVNLVDGEGYPVLPFRSSVDEGLSDS